MSETVLADFDILQSDCEAIVNPVNCVGVMGKGLALEFRRSFPEMYAAYRDACAMGQVQLGKMDPYVIDHTRTVINFPTKQHWRNSSHISYIERGLIDLRRTIKDLGLESIAIPALGCGNGGLDWDHVERLIKYTLSDLDLRIDIYPPSAARYTLGARNE